MTALQSSERSLGNVVAAVSHVYECPPTTFPSSSPCAFSPDPTPLHPPIQPKYFPAPAHFGLYEQPPSMSGSSSEAHRDAPSMHYIQLPAVDSEGPPHLPEHFRPSPLIPIRRPGSTGLSRMSPGPRLRNRKSRTLSPGPRGNAYDEPESAYPRAREVNSKVPYLNNTLTDEQTHHMRHSPPIQPGEQNFPGKLPSFSEFLNTTRANTPPHTPSCRNSSAAGSPQAKPHFDEVAWVDGKRRRVDTLGDIYARPPAERPPVDPRRMSSAIDPALVNYGSSQLGQHRGAQGPVPVHHRPSHSFPPPPHRSIQSGAQFRHQSTPPVSQGSTIYTQQTPRQSTIAQSTYPQSMVPQGAMYDHRPSYYQEPQGGAYGYERSHDSYYNQPSYPGPPQPSHDNVYGDSFRFQTHVGIDQNYNRKRRGNLPKDATNTLKEWFAANRASPYPTEDQKLELCDRTGLSLNQVSNWFINARRRAPQKELREREANNPET
ncbi:uncharacterized protein K460DRAFT_375866 [Cucurbitaria berberidis CBS 394.84]|uniref:Homeobox domain-containing protein n=1 Tax=Cucurbitaria berberidis CBS 394.84 TaxID=1168544 RepID=A0A9P4LBL1_9PLEO|nr:uncharacterized protein K460DRAFT_375866 [Cucurbitaria berberidis CBS 394.84]KAF1849170.1 hypothetical protein K460DRAFT_375866 [Cucurbitaria berberidis CBS 394.84]